MSQDNQFKSENNSSTIKNLFRQSEPSESQIQNSNKSTSSLPVRTSSKSRQNPSEDSSFHETVNNISEKQKSQPSVPYKEEEAKNRGFMGKIRSFFASMKQSSDIYETEEDTTDDAAPAKKRSLIQMLKIESYDDSSTIEPTNNQIKKQKAAIPEQVQNPLKKTVVPVSEKQPKNENDAYYQKNEKKPPFSYSAPNVPTEQPAEQNFVPEAVEQEENNPLYNDSQPEMIEQPAKPEYIPETADHEENTSPYIAPQPELIEQSVEQGSIPENETEQPTEDLSKTPMNEKTDEPDPESENVIYSSVKKEDNRSGQELPSEKQKNERMKKELPAFDIFEEFSKEQKKKQEAEMAGEKEAPVKETSDKEKIDNISPDTETPLTESSDNQVSDTNENPAEKEENNKTEDTENSKIDSSDPPKKDERKILPWGITNKENDASDNVIYGGDPTAKRKVERDLTEGYVTSVTYHYSTAVPIIVMAGKFSKTLRTEYEAVRIFRANGSLSRSALKKSEKFSDYISSQTDTKMPQKPVSENKKTDSAETKKESAAFPPIPVVNLKPSLSQEQGKTVTIPLKKDRSVNQKQNAPMNLNDVMRSEPTAYEEKPVIKEKKKKTSLKIEKHKAAKAEKEKKKHRIGYLFNSEEDYDPDDDINRVVVPKPMLDDYNEESDAEAISTEISTNFQAVFARTIVLLATSIASLALALIGQCTNLFSETIRNGWLWFALIGFVFFAVSVFVSRSPILNGLFSLKHFKGNSDTAVAVASVAAAMQSFTAMFSPDIYLNGKYYIYTSLVTLALLCNSIGKLLIITRTHFNFSFLIKPYPKYAGKIYTDKTNAEKMSAELPTHRAIIGYTKRSKFMSNFLQLSYAPDPSEDLAAAIAPWTALFSVICGVVYGLINLSFLGGLASFALTAFMSVPIISLLSVNIPLRRLCKHSLKGGAMVTSYETVKQFCDTNSIMIDSSQLYPKGSVTLSGMKSFKQSKLNDALLSGAAIMYAVNGTMIHVFENIVQCSKEQLPKVESVIYEDGKGLVGWVSGQRVLIGNRTLLESHNILPPEMEVEEKYLAMGNEITYISVGGELIAMFILSYKTNKNVAVQLKKLEQDGVCFIVRTVDSNLTREMVAKNFGLFYRCITILPTNLGNICHEAMTSVDDRSRAYLVTRGRLSSFARAVSGCIRMKSNVTISRILQCVGMGMGLAIVTLISFVSGFEKLGCLEMLIYTGFWSVTTLIATMIRK